MLRNGVEFRDLGPTTSTEWTRRNWSAITCGVLQNSGVTWVTWSRSVEDF